MCSRVYSRLLCLVGVMFLMCLFFVFRKSKKKFLQKVPVGLPAKGAPFKRGSPPP